MSGKGWWNSALSGLESRLDTILAEDDQASAKQRAADAAAKHEGADKAGADKTSTVEPEASRNSSQSRPTSRLQDRLAKAVNKGAERSSLDLGSRPASPALRNPRVAAAAATAPPTAATTTTAPATTPTPTPTTPTTSDTQRPSIDAVPAAQHDDAAKTEETVPAASSATSLVSKQPAPTAVPAMSAPSITTPQPSSSRQSFDSTPSRTSVDAATPAEPAEAPTMDPDLLQTELSELQSAHEETIRGHREEVNSHLERIDALQSKLTYLSQQLASSAKAASSDAEATPADKKLADKDAQIAALMEEGQKLSKAEMKYTTTIKTLRAKIQEQNKDISTLKQRLSKAEKGILEQSERARRAEAAEKSAQEKLKIVGKIEKDIEVIKTEREEAGLTISDLQRQLKDALSRAEDAEKRAQAGALEAEKRATASLKEDIENMRIEKKLAEDRAKRELQASREEAKSQQERAKVTELELRGEIANLESKLELLRSRSEEATSSATGDSQAKLLRQIETLQSQYSLASQNWQGIETSLTSRIAELEKDRDETAKRESNVRRKARDVNSKARRLEDELESINERARTLEHNLTENQSLARKLQDKLDRAEAAAQDARLELEREKKIWEAEVQQRLEEEKTRWKLQVQPQVQLGDPNHLRADSPSTTNRRHSPDPLGIYGRKALPRSISPAMHVDMPLSPIDRMFDDARRPSSTRFKSTSSARTPEIGTLQRQDSTPSIVSNRNGRGSISNTPSIHTIDHDDSFDNMSSPHHTINDMLSVSTVGAGPSVQLVERMSAAVRRLESEKATSKEELARLMAQRDEAREEVVALMREVEDKRSQDQKMERLEKELKAMDERYQTTLEMLGEKTEKVEELEGDVADLKKIYRELVQTMK